MAKDAPSHSGPHHVAIIMDGNGRWAQARGRPRCLAITLGQSVCAKLSKVVLQLVSNTLRFLRFRPKIGSGPRPKFPD